MKERWVGFGSGVLFAAGLALSGMTDPGKVLAFLDVAGAWDPTLAFVMGGAVGFHALWLRFTRRAPARPLSQPATNVDGRLVLGAALFGIGWGMSGYCPGPALSSFAYGRGEALLFVVAMLGGMTLFRLWQGRAPGAGR